MLVGRMLTTALRSNTALTGLEEKSKLLVHGNMHSYTYKATNTTFSLLRTHCLTRKRCIEARGEHSPDQRGQTGKLPSTVTLTGFGTILDLAVLVEKNSAKNKATNNQAINT